MPSSVRKGTQLPYFPLCSMLLHIAPSAVEVHPRNPMCKVDPYSVAELTKYAIRQGLTLI